MEDIPWNQTSFEGHKLKHLSLQDGFFFNGHRAVNDYQAVILLLSHAGFPENRSTLSLLLEVPEQSESVCGPNTRLSNSRTLSRPVSTAGTTVPMTGPKPSSSTNHQKMAEDKIRFLFIKIYQREISTIVRSLLSKRHRNAV